VVLVAGNAGLISESFRQTTVRSSYFSSVGVTPNIYNFSECYKARHATKAHIIDWIVAFQDL
jgi:hypothetical protein